MLHAVRIKAGRASYSNAYVQTSLFKQEKKAGRPLKLKAYLLFTPYLACACMHYYPDVHHPLCVSAPCMQQRSAEQRLCLHQ